MNRKDKGKDIGVFWLALELGLRLVTPVLLLLYLGLYLKRLLGTGVWLKLILLHVGLGGWPLECSQIDYETD